MSVDGVHCRIWEPRHDPSTKWYSKKFNKAALTYLVAIAIFHDIVVYVDGPYPASKNDWAMFTREGGLASLIPAGKMGIGDEGFKFDATRCATYNQFDSDDVFQFKSRCKARQESFNSRLKAFRILSEDFRCTGETRLEKHGKVFRSCVLICQYDMDNGRGLMKV